jgi:hypothetical protein
MLKKSRGLERNWALKKRNCILKEGLSFGSFQNLEGTGDSLGSFSTLRKGPVTARCVWKEHLKSSAPEVTEKTH